MLIYALQSFTATDGTVCAAKGTYTVTDTAGNIAMQRGQAVQSDSPDARYRAPVNWNQARTSFVDPVTGALYAALPLDANGYPVANIIPRKDTLSNLLNTIAGGVGEISEATDWNALVLHNGVAGQAKVLYCKPKRGSAFSVVAQSSTSGTPIAISFGSVQLDTDGVWAGAGNPTRFNVPAGANRVRLFASCSFAANATGNRQLQFKDSGGGSTPGAVSVTAAAGAMAVQVRSLVTPLTGQTYFELYATQNSGGALNVGGFGVESTYMEAEFWVE